MLHLGLQSSDCRGKLPLVFEVRIPDQLRMIQLHHLKLVGGAKLLLDQIVTLTSMRLSYL